MVVTQRQFARLLLRLDSCPGRMDHLCSPAVKHRRWLLPRLARVRMNKSLMRWLVKAGLASCFIIISRHIQLARLAVLVRLVVVKLVMENWHGVRFVRCCQPKTNFRTRSGLFLKSPNQTDHLQWRPFVVVHWR